MGRRAQGPPKELHYVHQMPMFCFISTRFMHNTNVDRFEGLARKFVYKFLSTV